MADVSRPAEVREPRGGLAAGLGLGLLGALVVVVLLVVPVIVMLQLPPGGTPTRLPDLLAAALLTVAGVVAAWWVRWASRRSVGAITFAVVLGLLALWFNANTWWPGGPLPAPPLLPNVGPTLTVASGAALAALWVALTQVPNTTGSATDAAGSGGTAGTGSLILGVAAPAVLIAVVELDVWGRGVLQQTFQGPWGLGRFAWLGLLFLGLLVASFLVGLVVASPGEGRSPAVALGVLVVGVGIIWVAAGELGGPPRSHLYGLGLGMLLLAVLSGLRTSGRGPVVEEG